MEWVVNVVVMKQFLDATTRCSDMSSYYIENSRVARLANLWMNIYKQGGTSVRTRTHNYWWQREEWNRCHQPGTKWCHSCREVGHRENLWYQTSRCDWWMQGCIMQPRQEVVYCNCERKEHISTRWPTNASLCGWKGDWRAGYLCLVQGQDRRMRQSGGSINGIRSMSEARSWGWIRCRPGQDRSQFPWMGQISMIGVRTQ